MMRDDWVDELAATYYPNYTVHPEYLDGMSDEQVIDNARGMWPTPRGGE